MKNDEAIKVVRPFGPSIARVKIPNDLIEILNSHVDKIISDEKKTKDLDLGSTLEGSVTQELKLENDFITSSGYHKFLSDSVYTWIKLSENKEIKKFDLINSWIVRQFQNEYNPIHYHGGHVSGVGYLKLPKSLGKSPQNKKNNFNGKLDLVHGSRQFLSESSFVVTPEIGYFYFFPHYLMHTVYPFNGSQDERRSVSFNAKIDEEIFDVYGK
jgi:hypothetical protein|tara:strand:+ start:85 stop:723 length:639 start_codon:yes stop_codon:yes gene_type:complete